jgi:hypothetical protein
MHQLYVMESTCPHLGADLSHADIEDHEEGLVAVCPWHRYVNFLYGKLYWGEYFSFPLNSYDFDLRTGRSETGLSACTYRVEVRTDPTNGVEKIFVEAPRSGTGWIIVELRAVSEGKFWEITRTSKPTWPRLQAFADPPPLRNTASILPVIHQERTETNEPIIPEVDPPRTLIQWAVLILNTPDPTLKVQRTRHAVEMLRTGKLVSIGNKSANAPRPPDVPPRVDSFHKNMVDPSKIKNKKTRAVMLHALANIEQWAWVIPP